jgi:sensor c-di-GMP phosphodiesterase-like protein
VAEGIENAATATWLREHGRHIGQGFFLSPPVSSAHLVAMSNGRVAGVEYVGEFGSTRPR